MIEIKYAKNAYDSQTRLKNGRPIKPDWDVLQFDYKRWKRGDPLPEFGTELGIDTETELITDTRPVPPLVVLGVYNPTDNTCYIVPWNDAQVFMHEILIRDCKIYLANAGFDYYELLSEDLQQAASDRKIIDILIRGALKEIATIGYIRTYSLKDACKGHLLYEMDKHEDEGDASVRLNFKTNKPLTDEECEYLSIDCATTYLAGHLMGPQATEDTHTLGSIVLTHIRNNGMEVDEEVFSYCENLLKSDMQVYRQQLIQFGFPDPLKKQEKTEMELLEEGWVSYITGYFKNFYEETYYIPTGIPNKVMCKRLLLYGMNFLKNRENKTYIARNLTTIMIQKKTALSKAEQGFWDRLCEDMDFLVPCDTSRKKCVWPLLLKKFLDDFLSISYEEGLTYEVMKENLDEYFQEHPEWVTDVPEVKPTDFIQDHLKKLEQEHKGLQFARTDKTGLLKCSKKDGWILADFDVKDPFLETYMNFIHVQKYLSTFCNREHIKSDGKVHPRYGVVATMRTSCSNPNVFWYCTLCSLCNDIRR